MSMAKIDDEILIVSAGSRVKIIDIAFMTPDSHELVPVAEGGELHYNTSEYGWILASECVIGDEPIISTDVKQLGESMVEWLDGLEPRPDNSNLPPIVTMLMAIQYDKEGSYGSSWKGKGEYRGIMANIDRKYDRLDKMTQDEIEGKLERLEDLERGLRDGTITDNRVGESKIDAIADFTNYGLLYMTYVREHFPRVFNVWVDKNLPDYLREKIPFIQE